MSFWTTTNFENKFFKFFSFSLASIFFVKNDEMMTAMKHANRLDHYVYFFFIIALIMVAVTQSLLQKFRKYDR